MKLRYILPLSLISLGILADPYTDTFRGKNVSLIETAKYFEYKPIHEKGSLVSVSSYFENTRGRIEGQGFILDVSGLNLPYDQVIMTNAHLLQGSHKKFLVDRVIRDRFENSTVYDIADDQTYVCANEDIAFTPIDNRDLNLPSFAGYYNGDFVTEGRNNSPRGYTLKPKKYGDELKFVNYNKRPLFENLSTEERFSFYQMGNMFDFSCNFYPSSPELYPGNAIFIPVTQRRQFAFVDPIPFVQKIYNKFNNFRGMLDMVQNNRCVPRLSDELKVEEQVKRNIINKNLVVPAGIVPGMSGSPLVINNDTSQPTYKVEGMVTSYDRRMQQSYFVGKEKIIECLKSAKLAEEDEVQFKYSKQYKTLYRSSDEFIEIPLARPNAGSVMNFSGGGAAGNGGGQDFGGGGAAGNGGGQDFSGGGAAGNGGTDNETTDVEFGILYKGEKTLGFNCIIGNKNYPIFANWEAKIIVENFECDRVDHTQDLDKLIKPLSGNKKAENKNLFLLSLEAEVKNKKGKLILKLEGDYFLKEEGDDISFSVEVELKEDLFKNPYIEIPITKDEITNWFNDYEGGEVLVIDVVELFFIDLTRLYGDSEDLIDALESHFHRRIHGSLRYKENSKGSIPITLEWK